MLTSLILFITACVLSRFMVLQVRRWALQSQFLDIPNERSSHTKPTPKGGGLAIASISLIFWLGWLLVTVGKISTTEAAYLVVAGLIAGMGWVDDLYVLSAKLRLLVQVVAAVGFVALIDVITDMELPGVHLSMPLWLALVINMLWVVGLVNAYNFMDGIDGIAGSQAVIAGIGWMMLAYLENQDSVFMLAGMVAATSVGFLFINIPPARIFMGDTGSTFLGFTFAALPIIAYAQTENPRLLISGAILTLPFIFDSLFTMIRRAINGENVLSAHRTHLYQRLIKKGYSHGYVTRLYIMLSLISLVCALCYYSGTPALMLLAVVILTAKCILLVIGVMTVEHGRLVDIA
jgi:UDP-N-acetylmuramyl pentapeptide phosphotransferase/UDP-N-acetylglucosamine-1-phosphate transferase